MATKVTPTNVIAKQARKSMQPIQRPEICLDGHSCLLFATPRRDAVWFYLTHCVDCPQARKPCSAQWQCLTDGNESMVIASI